jgi:STE24 endopeptidase
MGFYVLLFFAALAVFELPGSFQGSFLLETAYGRSNETALQWLWRWIKARALLAVVLTPTALGFLALLRKYPRSWAWRTATFAWLLAVFLTAIQPLVIEPLFHDRKPLEEGLLRNDLTALAQRAGVPTEKIFVINASRETKRANAFFIGIGGTRQILLFDNLLVHYSFAEIESILAHEIGHWKMKHIVIGLGLLFPAFIGAALLIAWVFKRARTAEMEAARVPLFFFLVFLISYASEPVTNAISRKLEGAADRFALELTGDPAAFVTMEVKLAKDNLTDLLPHPLDTFYFASHPPPLERIRRAAGFGLGS